MKSLGAQILVLLALAGVTGTIAKIAREGDPEKDLAWSTNLYDTSVKPAPANDPETPSSTPDGGPAPAPEENPSDPKATTPSGDPTAPTTSSSGNGAANASAAPPETATDPPPSDDKDAESEPEDGFDRLEFAGAREEFESGATFIDARRTREYVEGHITGAVSLSPYEQSQFAEKIVALQESVPEEATLVVYCSASADCEDSAMVAKQLQNAGFVDVRIYKGGFPEWEAKLKDDPVRDKLITKGAEPGEIDQ